MFTSGVLGTEKVLMLSSSGFRVVVVVRLPNTKNPSKPPKPPFSTPPNPLFAIKKKPINKACLKGPQKGLFGTPSKSLIYGHFFDGKNGFLGVKNGSPNQKIDFLIQKKPK